MVAFPLLLRATQPALAVVAAHGLTDLDSADWVPVYAAWCLVPDMLVTPAFVASSIVHFESDIGRAGSLGLHCAVGVLWLLCGQQIAFEAILLYLAAVHVPLHYWRCLLRGRVRGVAIAATATVAFLALSDQIGGVFSFEDMFQRIASAHITHEVLLEYRYQLNQTN